MGATPHRTEEDIIDLTLSAITQHIMDANFESEDIPVSTYHPFMAAHRSGNDFLDVPKLRFIQLTSKIGPETTDTLSPKREPYAALLEIEDELSFFQKLLRRDAVSDEGPKIPGVAPSQGKGKDKVPANTPRRCIIQWQLSTLLLEYDSFSFISKQLVDQFVRNYFPHPLLQKCWGALDAISEVRIRVAHKARNITLTQTIGNNRPLYRK